MLKARQWGGSTTTQLYMAWLQFLHKKGLNSLIIAHQGSGSDEIKDMFDRMIADYPVEMLHPLGDAWSENEVKMVGVGKSGSIHRVPQRNCKIKIGTAERPDSCRGGDYNLVHLSEVGLWRKTEGKSPEDIVRSACSGILYRPLTMIVYESTANGTPAISSTPNIKPPHTQTPMPRCAPSSRPCSSHGTRLSNIPSLSNLQKKWRNSRSRFGTGVKAARKCLHVKKADATCGGFGKKGQRWRQ